MFSKLFIVVVGLLGLWSLSSCGDSSNTVSKEKRRELANVLFNQELYDQSISEYRAYLEQYPLDAGEQANIAYRIASIYLDRKQDYDNALAYFLRAKHFDPQSKLQPQIAKKIVECLERLNRSSDARQVVTQSAALVDSQKIVSRPGKVLARIGDREITSGDVEYQISQLPDYMQKTFSDPQRKKEFLQQYVANELLYESALRQGLDSDPEIQRGVFDARKGLMVEKLVSRELEKTSGLENYTNADVETYYRANITRYAEKDESGKVIREKPFSEVAQQVAADFRMEKQQQAYQKMVERLMRSGQVQIVDE